jgi:polysaccharide biosynthesis protein PslH
MAMKRISNKRLLMLTHRFPYPPNRGDRIRSYNVLRMLCKKFRVTLGCTADEHVHRRELAHIESLCDEVCVAPLDRCGRIMRALKSFASGKSLTEGMFRSPELFQQVSRWQQSEPFDAAFVFCSSMFPYVDNRVFANTPKVVDLVDVDSQKWQQMGRESYAVRKWLYRAESKRVLKLEQRIAAKVNAIVLVSEREAGLFEEAVPIPYPKQCNVHGISNGVDSHYFSPPTPKPVRNGGASQVSALSLIFTGVLDYRPNVEGIEWFCRQVLPRLRPTISVCLTVVGRRPCKRVLDLRSIPGVDVIGEVPDVRPYLCNADVAISPLKIARGMQNKVLEAMAVGLPIVVTPQSAEGIEARSGKEWLIADTAAQWHAALVKLATNPAERANIGLAARKLVVNQFSWAARLEHWVEVIESAMASVVPEKSPEPLVSVL